METPHQAITRLLTALEALTQEEEHLFAKGRYTESTAVQQRSMPLVRKIAELLVGPNVAQTLAPDLQVRIQTLLKNRQTHYDRLTVQLDVTQKELEKINTAQARTKRMRPVYRQPATASFAGEA